MTSKIEEGIEEIFEYLDNCKAAPLKTGKILVDKEEIYELLQELKKNAPEEIKQIRKIVANKEAILNDAKEKAEALISDATNRTNQLLSENEIMVQAYSQADAIIDTATAQAQEIVDSAMMEANSVREAAFVYMDEKMAELENIVVSAMDANNQKFMEFQETFDQYYKVIQANRAELHPEEIAAEPEVNVVTSTTGELNIDMI